MSELVALALIVAITTIGVVEIIFNRRNKE